MEFNWINTIYSQTINRFKANIRCKITKFVEYWLHVSVERKHFRIFSITKVLFGIIEFSEMKNPERKTRLVTKNGNLVSKLHSRCLQTIQGEISRTGLYNWLNIQEQCAKHRKYTQLLIQKLKPWEWMIETEGSVQ